MFRNCCIAHLSRTQNHWQTESKECNLLKMNPYQFCLCSSLYNKGRDIGWGYTTQTDLPYQKFYDMYACIWALTATYIDCNQYQHCLCTINIGWGYTFFIL